MSLLQNSYVNIQKLHGYTHMHQLHNRFVTLQILLENLNITDGKALEKQKNHIYFICLHYYKKDVSSWFQLYFIL